MKCNYCGKEINDLETFCPRCGKQLVFGDSISFKRDDRNQESTFAGYYDREEDVTEIGEEPTLAWNSQKTYQVNSNGPDEVPPFQRTAAPQNEVPPFQGTAAPQNEAPPFQKTVPPQGFGPAGSTGYHSQFQNGNNAAVKKKKKKLPVILAICIIILLLVLGFVWLTANTYTEDDAKALVKAELDSDILGKYDEDFDFSNFTREDAMQSHEDTIRALVDSEQDTERFSDSLRDRTAEMWEKALESAQYSVEKAEQQDDGNFVVRVVTKPLDLYAGMDGSFYADLFDTLAEQYPDENADSSDNPEYFDSMWSLELDQIIDNNLKNPSYRSEEYNTVRVYTDEDGEWIADADDLQTIENKLFFYGSRWDDLFQ